MLVDIDDEVAERLSMMRCGATFAQVIRQLVMQHPLPSAHGLTVGDRVRMVVDGGVQFCDAAMIEHGPVHQGDTGRITSCLPKPVGFVFWVRFDGTDTDCLCFPHWIEKIGLNDGSADR